jgi:hypothetical protein
MLELIIEKFGARLDVPTIAKALNLAKGTVRNRISQDSLGFKTYVEGGKRYADARDVASYLESCREAR